MARDDDDDAGDALEGGRPRPADMASVHTTTDERRVETRLANDHSHFFFSRASVFACTDPRSSPSSTPNPATPTCIRRRRYAAFSTQKTLKKADRKVKSVQGAATHARRPFNSVRSTHLHHQNNVQTMSTSASLLNLNYSSIYLLL